MEIVLGKSKEHKAIAKAVRRFLAAQKKAKDLERVAGVDKESIRAFADQVWLANYSIDGLPSSPFKLITPEGEAVNYVVQDKTDGAELKAEQLEDLRVCLGETAAANLLESGLKMEFNPDVLEEPSSMRGQTVAHALAAQMGSLLRDMASIGIISERQRREVMRVRSVTRLKGNILGTLPELTCHSVNKISQAIKALGSAVSRFVRA